MKIVCIADTHGLHWDLLDLPIGDVLVIAGDVTNVGDPKDLISFNRWIGTHPHPHKLIVPGNHDFCFEENYGLCEDICTEAKILLDSAFTIEGVNFYGTPQQPHFYSWAFNIKQREKRKEYFDRIPKNTDVLITHAPPYGILDKINENSKDSLGDVALQERINELPNLKLNVFGHIHGGYGRVKIGNTEFINCSIADERYGLVNAPIVVDI